MLVLVVAIGSIAGACGGDDGGPRDPNRLSGRYASLHTELCTAADQASANDLAGARRTFDDVHVGLHDLAAAAEAEDRATAARLLEAKQRVELRLDATTLGDLVPAVAAAVRVTGGTAPDSCS